MASPDPVLAAAQNATPATAKPKLHGRAFYESIGSPKFVVAPMVDQSEFVRYFYPFCSFIGNMTSKALLTHLASKPAACAKMPFVLTRIRIRRPGACSRAPS